MLQKCYGAGSRAGSPAPAPARSCARPLSLVYTRVGELEAGSCELEAARETKLQAEIEGGIFMVTYFYFYVSEEELHAVMIQRDNGDGTFSVRPVSAYYREKTAREVVAKHNERLADRALPRAERKNLPPVRTNAPLEYFHVPEWWTDRCPNWPRMERVV